MQEAENMQALVEKHANEIDAAIAQERNLEIQAIDEQVQDVAYIMEHLA